MTTLTLFEQISMVYQNLRALVVALENETGAKICVTVASEEHLDEGFVVLKGIDNIIRKYDVKDVEEICCPYCSECEDYSLTKVRFRLFGIKFEGYKEERGSEK